MTSHLKYQILVLWCFWSAHCWAQQYDLIIKGGTVIDPKNKLHAVLDLAVSDGLIKKVAPDIPAEDGLKILNAQGLFVTPGLIDIHTHVFVGINENTFAGGFSSVSPDDFSFRSGITTMVDAGTSGWRSFPKFKAEVIDRSQTRVLAFLNITGAGMIGVPGEESLDDMDVGMTLKTIQEYSDIIVGVKIGHYRDDQWTPFDRALEASDQAQVPLLVECHLPNWPLDELLHKMRSGDIITHTYGAVDDRMSILDESGRLRACISEAREKGVYFDVGHGGGSFHYSQALPAVDQGFFPDSFGTDLHRFSMNAGMKDILNIMSKFLNMGMSLEDIIDKATWSAAKMIHQTDLGNLSEGTVADIALLRIRDGSFGYTDAAGFKINGQQRLEAELTIRKGKVVWDLNGLAAEPYEN